MEPVTYVIGVSHLLTDPSTKVPFPVCCENSIKIPILLITAETTQKSDKQREVFRPELEFALLEWFLQYEEVSPNQ